MALTQPQIGELALAIYRAWAGVSGDRGDLDRAVSLVRQYLDATAGIASWNATAAQFGLPAIP